LGVMKKTILNAFLLIAVYIEYTYSIFVTIFSQFLSLEDVTLG
ncbi:unnamed protein product, partial [marine sediment metagenome]